MDGHSQNQGGPNAKQRSLCSVLKDQCNEVSLEKCGGCGRKGKGTGKDLEVGMSSCTEKVPEKLLDPRGDRTSWQVIRAIAWSVSSTGSVLHLPAATEVSDRNLNLSSWAEE